jgi:hypothetical protein
MSESQRTVEEWMVAFVRLANHDSKRTYLPRAVSIFPLDDKGWEVVINFADEQVVGKGSTILHACRDLANNLRVLPKQKRLPETAAAKRWLDDEPAPIEQPQPTGPILPPVVPADPVPRHGLVGVFEDRPRRRK